MAGEESVLGRCTDQQKAATCEESSTEGTPGSCTAQQKSSTDEERRTTEPNQAEGDIKEEEVPETQAEEAEYADGYEDEAEYDYQDDTEYDDEAVDDYDYDEDYEEDEYEPEIEEQRPKVRAILLSFPGAAELELHELDAAVERVLEQSKPEYENVAAPGKIRLLREDIELALDQWTPPPPSIVNNWCPNHTLSADSIRMYEELDKEFLPLYGKSDEEREREQFRAKVRRELLEKGYVEVEEDYYDKKDEYERQMMEKIQEEWNQMVHFRRSRGAKNE
ncbi:unnamed protein product [Alopecurus aequalis]